MNNVASYFAQVAVLIGVGALLPKLARVHHPRAYLIYCQALLAACFVLPAVQPWERTMFARLDDRASGATVRIVSPGFQSAPFDWERALFGLLAAGASIRAGWLGLGLLRLRRYRRAAAFDSLPEAVSGAQRLVGVTADFRCADADGPVTFGWRRAVVLLPPGFAGLTPGAQLSIAVHELIHVRRRDWLFLMAEEIASVTLWFHPAVQWLVARIRLAREQSVDQEAVALLGNREPYLECLLDMAGAPPRLDLAPASLFLRRRHLSQRIRSLLQEVTVSKTRIANSYACIAALLALAMKVSILFFPLTGEAQVVDDSPGVRVESGGKILYRTPVPYPAAARTRKVEGTVTVDVTLAKDGTVADARVIGGPDELRRAALASVLNWHYDAASSPERLVAAIEFRIAVPRSQGPSPLLTRIDLEALRPDLRESLRIRLAPFIGQLLTPEANAEINAIVAASRVPSVLWTKDTAGNAVITLGAGPMESSVTPPADFPPPEDGVKRIRVGGNAQSGKIASKVAPEYPAVAKQARIQGTVRFNVLIARDGAVRALALVAGHPLLVESAQRAVPLWKYQPTYLNGEPAEVLTVVDVNYTLAP